MFFQSFFNNRSHFHFNRCHLTWYWYYFCYSLFQTKIIIINCVFTRFSYYGIKLLTVFRFLHLNNAKVGTSAVFPPPFSEFFFKNFFDWICPKICMKHFFLQQKYRQSVPNTVFWDWILVKFMLPIYGDNNLLVPKWGQYYKIVNQKTFEHWPKCWKGKKQNKKLSNATNFN